MTSRIQLLAAVVILSLGGFFLYKYGQARERNGYDACVSDTKRMIDETTKTLERQRDEVIPDSDVIIRLHNNNWLRPDSDI